MKFREINSAIVEFFMSVYRRTDGRTYGNNLIEASRCANAPPV
jgi:hypothetical protein